MVVNQVKCLIEGAETKFWLNFLVWLTKMEGGERSDLLVDVESDDTQKDNGSSDDTDMDSLKAELKETKDKLNEALSEVAVAQVLQENLCSVERQKVLN